MEGPGKNNESINEFHSRLFFPYKNFLSKHQDDSKDINNISNFNEKNLKHDKEGNLDTSQTRKTLTLSSSNLSNLISKDLIKTIEEQAPFDSSEIRMNNNLSFNLQNKELIHDQTNELFSEEEINHKRINICNKDFQQIRYKTCSDNKSNFQCNTYHENENQEPVLPNSKEEKYIDETLSFNSNKFFIGDENSKHLFKKEKEMNKKLLETLRINSFPEEDVIESLNIAEYPVYENNPKITINQNKTIEENKISNIEESKKSYDLRHNLLLSGDVNTELIKSLQYQIYLQNIINLNPLLRNAQLLYYINCLQKNQISLLTKNIQSHNPIKTNNNFGKPGWTCIYCNNFNYQIRIKCNRCGRLPQNSIINDKMTQKNFTNNKQNSEHSNQIKTSENSQNFALSKLTTNYKSDGHTIIDESRVFFPKEILLNREDENKEKSINTSLESTLLDFQKEENGDELKIDSNDRSRVNGKTKKNFNWNFSNQEKFSDINNINFINKTSKEKFPNKFDMEKTNNKNFNECSKNNFFNKFSNIKCKDRISIDDNNLSLNNTTNFKNMNDFNSKNKNNNNNFTILNNFNLVCCQNPIYNGNIPLNSNMNQSLMSINDNQGKQNNDLEKYFKSLNLKSNLKNSCFYDSCLNQKIFYDHNNISKETYSNSSFNRNESIYQTLNNSNFENFLFNSNLKKRENTGMNEVGNFSSIGCENSSNINYNINKQKKKPFVERIGDWVCIKCKNLNFSFRTSCNRCQMSKLDCEKYSQNCNKYFS